MVTFSYGAAASSFLSRGVRFASEDGSNVLCMQPPRTRPKPNRTTNPRIDIIDLFFFRRPGRQPRIQLGLTELQPPLPRFPDHRASAAVNVLRECRTSYLRRL